MAGGEEDRQGEGGEEAGDVGRARATLPLRDVAVLLDATLQWGRFVYAEHLAKLAFEPFSQFYPTLRPLCIYGIVFLRPVPAGSKVLNDGLLPLHVLLRGALQESGVLVDIRVPFSRKLNDGA